MKNIEKTVKYFMFSGMFFFLAAVLFFGLMKYVSFEPLFIAPEENSNRSVKMLQESTNLESMKKACLIWAKSNDYHSEQIDELLDLVFSLLQSMVLGAMVLSAFFAYGFFNVYLKLKNIQSSNSNAL